MIKTYQLVGLLFISMRASYSDLRGLGTNYWNTADVDLKHSNI
ncbi:hypothetical protein [Lactiplantibacillus paraplantarum]|nr:hypothetical protein [Lactiplantibacillus paraplantarum]